MVRLIRSLDAAAMMMVRAAPAVIPVMSLTAPGVVALMLDCDDAMRFERLRVRGTPHQIGNAVVARAEQFRQHAAAAGVPVLNTCRMPFGSVVRTVLAHCEHGPRPILHRKAFHSRHRAAFAWLF